MSRPETILVTGATGYIGGRLVPRLVGSGCRVRVLVRSRSRVAARAWQSQVEVAVGDVLDAQALSEALAGVDTAYYLVHSMSSGADFHERDMQAARAFGRAAKAAGVNRIIYLGGLGDPASRLSHHLRSRQSTGQALREGGVPVTEFRAAVIVGAGSISFEMIRYLVERLPVMICPRWIYSRIQPIAVDDLLEYLVSALDAPESQGQIVEIGGKDAVTYRGMMLGYAQARGLKRLLLPVPVLTPRLSAYWVHWITPIHAGISSALIEGLHNDVVVTNDLARRLFPDVDPMEYAGAIARVIDDLDAGRIDTSWSDALGTAERSERPVRLDSRHGTIVERRRMRVSATPRAVFRVFTGIGGARGWYFATWAWRLRGALDRVLGGVGLRRGRRHPDHLRIGDALDFWRVEDLRTDRSVRLRAEMKLPGRAWLQFETREAEDGATHLEQTAAFIPKGLPGLAYWYGLYPLHRWIFAGLVKAIARRAERM
ncbi:MAG: SDR family oxidoreductase [Chloroflexi bacterium]|nr:SDR family oxidoreductase [Chloroflexota bacterium]